MLPFMLICFKIILLRCFWTKILSLDYFMCIFQFKKWRFKKIEKWLSVWQPGFPQTFILTINFRIQKFLCCIKKKSPCPVRMLQAHLFPNFVSLWILFCCCICLQKIVHIIFNIFYCGMFLWFKFLCNLN